MNFKAYDPKTFKPASVNLVIQAGPRENRFIRLEVGEGDSFGAFTIPREKAGPDEMKLNESVTVEASTLALYVAAMTGSFVQWLHTGKDEEVRDVQRAFASFKLLLAVRTELAISLARELSRANAMELAQVFHSTDRKAVVAELEKAKMLPEPVTVVTVASPRSVTVRHPSGAFLQVMATDDDERPEFKKDYGSMSPASAAWLSVSAFYRTQVESVRAYITAPAEDVESCQKTMARVVQSWNLTVAENPGLAVQLLLETYAV